MKNVSVCLTGKASNGLPCPATKRRTVLAWVGAAATLALVTGCASSDRADRPAVAAVAETAASSPPPFLGGPAALLLTNGPGFAARAVVDLPNPLNGSPTTPGQLFGRGSRLVFTPSSGGVYFIWDAKENSGYVVNEALQGFAPITSAARVASVAGDAELAGPMTEKIDGHSCKRVDVIMALNEGPAAQFTVWRARDLSGFPLRLSSANGPTRFTLNLSNVRLQPPGPEVFLPPEGFTKYADAPTMMGELLARKATMKRKVTVIEANTEQMPEPGRGRR